MKTAVTTCQRVIVAMITLLVAGCSSLPTLDDIAQLSPWYTYNDVKSVSVYVAPDENLRHAVSIDVVFVYNDLVLTMVSGMNALDWFSQKQAMMASYGTQIKLLEWQMVGSYADQSKPLPDNHGDAISVLAFAYYPENPDAKAVLTELETPWLVFSKGTLSAVEEPPASFVRTNGR